MARKYEKVRELLPVVQRLQAEGKTRKEIARELGLQNERTVKDLLYRARHKQEKAIPKQRGRKPAKTLAEYKYENKRLKMENKLLRDFLQSAGRLVQAMLGTYGYRRMCLAKKPKHPQKSQDSTCIMKKYYLLSEIRCRRQ